METMALSGDLALLHALDPGVSSERAQISRAGRLIASGRHDALLCSRLIGVLERD